MPLAVRVLGQQTGHKSEFVICHIVVLTVPFCIVYNDVTQKEQMFAMHRTFFKGVSARDLAQKSSIGGSV